MKAGWNFPPKVFLINRSPATGEWTIIPNSDYLAIALALKDAQLDQWTEMRNIAIMASTVYGCLQTDADYYDTVRARGGPSGQPEPFCLYPVQYLSGRGGIYFGLTGAGFIIHEPSLSGCSGLLLAMNSLARKECEAVITGICDTGPPLSLGLTGRAVPGALFFVLQTENAGLVCPMGH